MKALSISLQILLFLCIGFFNECKSEDLSIEPLIIPTPVATTDGKIIVYELHAINKESVPVHIGRVEVYDSANKTKPLIVYADEDLKANIRFYTHDLKDAKEAKELGPGMQSILYVYIKLREDQQVPQSLEHDIWITNLSDDRKKVTVNKIEYKMAVNQQPPLVLEPPLKGKNWVAEAAISPDSYHRRTILALEGKLYLAQRFAVDWVQIDAEGREVHGDLSIPKNWLAYGQDVLSVCDGVVTKVQEGFKDRTPPGLPTEIKTLEEVTGNTIMLSTEQNGEKYYIMYAHLKEGSLLVKPGDHVVKGQIIAQVGNTGNTSAPHLHIHVGNADDTLKSEGLPFVFKQAKIQGMAEVISLDYGQWKWDEKLAKDYTVYKNIIPTTDQVFDFSK